MLLSPILKSFEVEEFKISHFSTPVPLRVLRIIAREQLLVHETLGFIRKITVDFKKIEWTFILLCPTNISALHGHHPP